MKSKELKEEASRHDSDSKAFGLYCKALRAERQERFEENWIFQVRQKYQVVTHNGGYSIQTSEFGTIDFYPKANKLLLRDKNQWIKPGLRWIINKLLCK